MGLAKNTKSGPELVLLLVNEGLNEMSEFLSEKCLKEFKNMILYMEKTKVKRGQVVCLRPLPS